MMRSFRVQATLLFGALALTSLSVLSYLLGGMLTSQALRERGEALQATANGAAMLLADGVHERMREVDLLAKSTVAQHIGLDAVGWRAEIDRLAAGRPHYAWVGVVDADGNVISATRNMLVGENVTKRPWYSEARRDSYAGDVHQAKLLAPLLPASPNGEPLRFIDFAAPLHGRSGELVGVLGVHADWRWARDVIATVRSKDARDAGTLVYILDRERRVIHHPDGPEATASLVTGATMPSRPVVLPWSDGERYLTTATPVAARTPVTALGWTVVVRQPLDKALAPVAQAQRAVWIAGGLVAGAAMALTWVLAGRLSRPLVEISEASERIDAGETDAEIPLSRRSSELERLSHSLSRMTKRLVLRERELAASNGQLEARVAARTAELAAANRQLESLAHQDGLTKLFNRRAADMLLDKEIAHHRRNERPLSVLLADIDHFKRINDTYGHAAGDEVLKAVAFRLGQVLRLGDIAARFGGEEFLVVLPETDAEGAVVVAEKVRESIASMRVPGVGGFTMSIGCAHVAAGGEPSHDLLKRADDALYQAKAKGRDRVMMSESVAVVPPSSDAVDASL